MNSRASDPNTKNQYPKAQKSYFKKGHPEGRDLRSTMVARKRTGMAYRGSPQGTNL